MFIVKWMDQTVQATSEICQLVDDYRMGRHGMMSKEKRLSNVSKELGCTPMKLRRRTILLGEKNFQDCRNSLRRWKHPVLQKNF